MTPDVLMETVLYPRKALQLFAFEYPVNRYFMAVKEEASPAAPAREKSFVAVFRHEDVVWRMELEANEYYLLEKLFAGMPIGEALETVQIKFHLPEDELMDHLSEYFSRWMRNGLLAHYEYIVESKQRSIA